MPKFIAMWNMPGCLPEMEPADFCTFNEAREFIADELESIDYSDHYSPFSPEDCAYTKMRALFLNAERPCASTVLPNGYIYSIAETDWDYVEARIGSHFLSYLINGDASGIDDFEEKLLDAYIARIQEGKPGGHWSAGSTEEFARCAVTGEMGQCVNVRYNFKEQP